MSWPVDHYGLVVTGIPVTSTASPGSSTWTDPPCA